jgi:hypothetical protein
VTPEASGTWLSTSRAAVATGSTCKDSLGNDLTNTGQPCGDSSNGQTGTASLTVSPAVLLGRQLGDVQLASFGTPTGATRAFGARFVTPTPTWCPTASGFGCVAAGAQRSMGDTVLGQLPSPQPGDVTPGGFQGAVVLTGYTASVRTSSGAVGAGAIAPSVARGGELKVWNGTGYTGLPALGSAAATFPVAAVGTYQGSGGLGTITVTVMGNVNVSAVSSSAAGCVATVCEASTGSIVADLTYDFAVAGVSTAGFRVRADLGALLAKTSFVGA